MEQIWNPRTGQFEWKDTSKVDLLSEDTVSTTVQQPGSLVSGDQIVDINKSLGTEGGILGSMSDGLGAIKGWAKPVADLAGGFAAIGGYNEAKKVNKAKIAEANANLRNANYNYENKVAFDNIMKNPNIGLGKVNV